MPLLGGGNGTIFCVGTDLCAPVVISPTSAEIVLEEASTRVHKSFYTPTEGASYLWDFGEGGNTSTRRNPVHTYPDIDPEATYTVTLTVTFPDSSTAQTTQDVTVSAIGNSTIPNYQTLMRPDDNGDRRFYYDATFVDRSLTANIGWYGTGGDNFSGRFGSFVFPSSGNYYVGMTTGNGRYHTRAWVKSVPYRDMPKPRFKLAFNLLEVTITDLTEDVGAWGISGIAVTYEDAAGNTSGPHAVALGGSTATTLPTEATYRATYTVTANAHPVSGAVETYQIVSLFKVSNTTLSAGATRLTPVPEYDFSVEDWENTYTQQSIETVQWGNLGMRTVVDIPNVGASYNGQPLNITGGAFLKTRAGVGETDTDAGKARILMGLPYVTAIEAHIGDPFHNTVFGSDGNNDYPRGPRRTQTSLNSRAGVLPSLGRQLEDSIATNEQALVVYALMYTFNASYGKNRDGFEDSYYAGSTNTLEGYWATHPLNPDFPPVQIQQGTQRKRTVDDPNSPVDTEGQPTQAVDSAGGLLLSLRDAGSDASSDLIGLMNDYPVSGVNGRRTSICNPLYTVDDETAYIMICASVLDGTTGRGPMRYWIIPTGKFGWDLNLHIKPIADYSDVLLSEGVTAPLKYPHIFTFGHYNSGRSGQNLNNMIKQYLLGHTDKYGMYIHSFPFLHMDIQNSISMPDSSIVLASVFDHFGRTYNSTP